jgi:hypothetical protein
VPTVTSAGGVMLGGVWSTTLTFVAHVENE